MRVWIVAAASLALVSCATTPGATSAQAPPFTAPQAQTPAADVSPTYPTAVDLPAGEYRLDPRHASVLFRIQHMGLSWFTARFETRDATLTLDPADPTRSHLTASVDATSVQTGITNQAGERSFDRSIGRALGAEASQQITFNSTAIQRTGQYTARVTGDLTMNGQTHPATFDVTFDGGAVDPLRGAKQVLGFSGHAVIQRSQWGVNEWRAFTSDEVQIVIEAELVKA
ncbi:YceI family protein [Terricaulis sp.]|uniref:YceI family protein n=1 Tax=Terricaulis sp. TaxID=2768686 RepID=UPI00378487C1